MTFDIAAARGLLSQIAGCPTETLLFMGRDGTVHELSKELEGLLRTACDEIEWLRKEVKGLNREPLDIARSARHD